MGRTNFSDQFRKIIVRHERIGYDLSVMRRSACYLTQLYLLSTRLCFFIVLKRALFVYRDDSLTS